MVLWGPAAEVLRRSSPMERSAAQRPLRSLEPPNESLADEDEGAQNHGAYEHP